MRVLILTQYFWPESFSINQLAATLREQGANVEILTAKPNYPDGKIYNGYSAWGCQVDSFQEIPIHRVPIFPRGNGGFGLAVNYLSFVISGLVFGPWMLRGKPFDVVFIYAPSPVLQAIPAILLGLIKKCPVVLWVQDLWPESLSATGYVENRIVLGSLERVVRWIYRRCDLLLVQSRGFEAPVRQLASGTPVAYYPNSVADAIIDAPEKSLTKIDGLGDGFSVLFTGNIGSAQAVGVIADVADILKSHDDIHFVIVGDGSCRDELQMNAKQRGLSNLHLPGRFPVEKMPEFMQQASALLVTLADKKIFSFTVPNKVQAYLAAGRPIIACLNGEGARIVKEANAGLTAPAEDAQSLSAAILRLYRMNPDERNQLGMNGRLYYLKHFQHETLAGELLGRLHSVCRASEGQQ